MTLSSIKPWIGKEKIKHMNNKIASYTSKYIYAIIVVIPFFASFSSGAVTGTAVSMLIAFLIKRAFLRDLHFTKTAIQWPFFLIVFFSLLSFIKTSDLRASAEGIWKLFYAFSLVTIITEELNSIKHVRRVVAACILGLLLASFDGIWQLNFGIDIFRLRPYAVQAGMGLPRIRASFPHTNIFAAYLILFLPLALTILMYHWKKIYKRTAYLIVFILAIFSLAFTFARGAALGILLALIFIGALKKSKLIFILLILVIVLAPIVMPAGIKYWAKEANSAWDILLNPERIGDYRNALNMIKSNLFLGVGVNTYCLNIDKYKIRDGSIYVGNAGYAHNIYLHLPAEIGIFGLIAFLWLIFSLFKYGLASYKTINNDFLKATVLGLMGGILAFLINGFTETVLYYPKVVVLFWYEVGLLLGIIRLNKKTSIKTK